MAVLDTLTMVREIDEEAASLVALRRLLDAAKKGAIELMRRYPEYRAAAQAVIDCRGRRVRHCWRTGRT